MMTAFSASRMSDAAHSHPSSEIIANLALERADFRLDVQLLTTDPWKVAGYWLAGPLC